MRAIEKRMTLTRGERYHEGNSVEEPAGAGLPLQSAFFRDCGKTADGRSHGDHEDKGEEGANSSDLHADGVRHQHGHGLADADHYQVLAVFMTDLGDEGERSVVDVLPVYPEHQQGKCDLLERWLKEQVVKGNGLVEGRFVLGGLSLEPMLLRWTGVLLGHVVEHFLCLGEQS